MKFYDNIKNPRYEASPFAIDVDGTHLFYTSTDARPFILYQSGIVFGVPGGEHDDIECRNKGKRPLIRGRWWVKANALVLWECTSSYEVKCSFLKKFVETVKRFGINGMNTRFFEDFGRLQEKDGERRMQIVIMETTIKEYISLNIQENEENWFWRIFDSQGKEKSLGGNITKNGMDSRDVWRHYEITESKTTKNMKKNVVKINENALRQIVAESVKNVLKEYQDGGLFDPYNEDPKVRKHQIDMAYAEKAKQDSGLDYASFMGKKSDQDFEKTAYEKGRAQSKPGGSLNFAGVARDQNWNTYDTGGKFGMNAQSDNPYMRHQAQRAGSTLAQSVKQGMNDFSGVGLDESTLKSIVRESVGKVLKEWRDDGPYFDLMEKLHYMKPEEAYEFIIQNANTGDEVELNCGLHFGMGVYAYTDAVNDYMPGNQLQPDPRNNAFVNLDKNSLRQFIDAVYKKDGGLS